MRLNADPESGVKQSRVVMTEFQRYMGESIQNAFAATTLETMGCLPEYVGTNEVPDVCTEEFDVLQTHGKFLWKFLKHVDRFQQWHFMVPYCLNAFLDLTTSTDKIAANKILQQMKEEWTFVLAEEAKNSKSLHGVHHVKWQVYRELMTCAEEEDWQLTPRFVALVRSYLPGRQNTIGLEHTFGTLRDAETRHSKHKQASVAQVCATTIRTTNKLFKEINAIVEPTPGMIEAVPGTYSQAILKKDCLHPCRTPVAECGIKHATEMLKNAENRTNAFNLIGKGLSQLRAHQLAFEQLSSKTDYLWVSSIIPEGVVICRHSMMDCRLFALVNQKLVHSKCIIYFLFNS